MRRILGSEPRIVAVERLERGQTIILYGHPPHPVKVLLRNPRRQLEIDGTRTVLGLLAELDLNRESHLVIRNGELVPGDARLEDDDTIEVRPVISGGSLMSKCRVCRGPAIIDLPRHNANFCAEHLQQFCRRQVEQAINDHGMLRPGERVLVAVSAAARTRSPCGTSFAELGYDADGLYIGLGIGEYSDDSGQYARAFADQRGLAAAHDRPPRRARLRRADRGAGHPPGAVLGVRAVQAPPVRRRRPRRRLRRRRHRPQPRRRGRRPPRQRAALGRRLPRPPAAVPAGRRRIPAQDQATGPARPSGRRRRGASCAASTTRSRSARWRPATGTSGTRPP